ncbi:MAG TPA: LON peptidase substrate-binding domain-containing protein [Armatimonadota bacterium]|jgi:Lon protease-like protein|nr:LON peptidase substrate-binding domain-containing protein [Armatimonadota bacterium]HOJ19961.1 LON peptidase substrate-binding domain-containing protein [Armatimonadota bacterium]HOM80341.1 LON peptidase substrate-binding domain-containing protein [Armatimonadota bacterium]HPO71822.1 LON peptidase substrate-binding domain-containing protein [Armatimonadota bacterium]HPT98590.1 LON peptidase substrate-binding domain-containing protein [Armatimonadota bacterium]
MELPILPLHTVLFPQMVLRLLVTEPPHLEMVQRCMDGDRTLGIVLARPGKTLDDIELCRVGTSAYIADLTEQGDGRTLLLVFGQRRFRLLDYRDGEYFVTGNVEWLPETGEDASVGVSVVTELLQCYLADILKPLGLAHPFPGEVEIPQEATELSYVVAMLLPLALSEKQRLLELPGPAARLEAEVPLLRQQIEADRQGGRWRSIARPLGKQDAEWMAQWRN